MGVCDPLGKLFHAKLFARADAEREVAHPSINGVGAEVDGNFKFF
jgi:hypothetical protein